MSEAKRVLLISSNSSARGGGERYLVFLSEGLKSLGVDVHVLLSNSDYMNGWEEDLRSVGATVHRCELKGLSSRPLRFLQSIADKRQRERISSICREIQPAAILVNQQYDEDGLDYVMGALQSCQCPVSGVIHMPMTACKNSRPFGWLRGVAMRSWYRKNPYHLVFSSIGGQSEFLDYYKLNLKTSIVPSGVPLCKTRIDRGETLERLKDEWITASMDKSASRLPVIGVACQFVAQKNLSLLIDGWLSAMNAGTPTRLLLIGDGPERKQIEGRLANVDRSLWHITGWTDKYSDYLTHLDLFVMTSHYEGLPLTLIEIAGMGISAIVAPFNGAKEVSDRAPWVETIAEMDALVLGRRIVSKVNQLKQGKVVSQEERDEFIDYFSPTRMAQDFLHVLGINLDAQESSKLRNGETTN